jgi:diguanylate cyclase (GGDEF)-like protein
MTPDFFTLSIVIALVSAALVTVWAVIAWRHRGFIAARIWFAACLLTALGGAAILPFGMWTAAPVVQAAAGNGMIILGFWLFWLGARRLHGLRDGWAAAFGASALCVLLIVAVFGHDEALAVTYAAGQSAPMALGLAFLLRQARRSPGAAISCAGLAIGLSGHAAVMAMNLWIWSQPGPAPDFSAVAAVTMLAVVFSGIVWNFGFMVMTIDGLRGEAALLAHTDPLTGVWNRRELDRRLTQEEAEARRSHRPFAVLLLDLDHFKPLNDRLGHAGGDACLVHLGRVVNEQIRAADLLARLGGDEFCVLMPGGTAQDARALGGRIARALASNPLLYEGRPVRLECSIGAAAWRPGLDSSAGTVMRRADAALYSAKSAGRGRVALETPLPLQAEA